MYRFVFVVSAATVVPVQPRSGHPRQPEPDA
jgi:hypothetical protein